MLDVYLLSCSMYICLRARKGKKERVLQKSFANSEKNSRLFNLFPLLSLSLSTPSLNTGPRQGWQSRRGRRGPQGRQGSQGELAVSIREEFVFPAPSSPSLSLSHLTSSLSLSPPHLSTQVHEAGEALKVVKVPKAPKKAGKADEAGEALKAPKAKKAHGEAF